MMSEVALVSLPHRLHHQLGDRSDVQALKKEKKKKVGSFIYFYSFMAPPFKPFS